jgi:hypothetical protein
MADPAVRSEAHSVLSDLFNQIGGQAGTGGSGGLLSQFSELLEMPMELAQIFTQMSVQLAELVLRSLEEAGMTLVKGLTPM